MELTITQNGALYAVQHGAIKKYRGARNKRAIANKAIPADKLLSESSRGIARFKFRKYAPDLEPLAQPLLKIQS